MELTLTQKETYEKALTPVHSSAKVREKLIEHGYYSPLHITRHSRHQFLSTALRNMGLEEESASKIYDRSKRIREKVTQFYMSLQATIGSPYYRGLQGRTVGKEVENCVVNLPGYQELFGSLNYMEGETWNSMFGLCAYFVDLMRITQQYITEPNESTIPSGMKLRERRPDLWELELDQKNTEQLLPYLTIVLEHLSSAVKEELKVGNPYKAMVEMEYPMQLPLNIPLERIRQRMKQAGVPLENVYRYMLKASDEACWEEVGIKQEEVRLWVQKAKGEQLANRYGILESELETLYQTEVFCRATGLSMEQLLSLLYQGTGEEERENAARFFINRGLEKGEWTRVEEGVLTPCKEETLDRINRFLKMSHRFGLSYEQMDWMIQCLLEEEDCTDFFFEKLVSLLSIAKQYSMELMDFISLFGQIKSYGKACKFEQIFHRGTKKYCPKDAWNEKYQEEWIEWNRLEDGETAAWLASCFQISMSELECLMNFLGEDTNILLTADTLSKWYAHLLLKQEFDLPMEEYAIFYSLAQKEGEDSKKLSFEKLRSLKELDGYRKKHKKTVYELDFLVRGIKNPFITYRKNEKSKDKNDTKTGMEECGLDLIVKIKFQC